MSIEKALDTMMESFGNSYTSALAINATSIAGERDLHIQHGLVAMRNLGTLLKEHNKTELYMSIQESVLTFVRTARQVTPKRGEVERSYEAMCDAATKLLNDPVLQQERAALRAKRIPVTVITGFLGSGKTTLLNYILSANHGKRIAVIENEFGEISIDDALVKDKFKDKEEIFEMNNGCICCTVRGDLIRILGKLADRKDKFDYVLVETTGLADPAPIAQTFFVEQAIAQQYRLDAILTVVDAKHIIEHLDEKKPQGVENEAVEQVAFADRILLNKIDLVNTAEKEEVKRRVLAINKGVHVIESERSRVPLDAILNLNAFDLDRVLDIDPAFMAEQTHEHDTSTTSVGLTSDTPLDKDKLNAWFSAFLKAKGASIYRMKGIIYIKGMAARFVFQGVHMLFDGQPGTPWEADERRCSKLVFIGKGLDRAQLQRDFAACHADA